MQATISSRSNTGTFRVCWREEGKSKQISCGSNRSLAEQVRMIINGLLDLEGDRPGTRLQGNIESLPKKIRDKVTSSFFSLHSVESLQLKAFVTPIVAAKENDNTRRNYRVTLAHLVEFFGPDRPMQTVRPSEADRYVMWIKSKVQESTANREIKRAKQLFATASRDARQPNPFAHIRCGESKNRGRIEYIPADVVLTIIDHITCKQDKLVLALSRFSGCRTMSETLNLHWGGVRFESGTLHIFSPKDGHKNRLRDYREIPIHKHVMPLLQSVWDDASHGVEQVVTSYGLMPAAKQQAFINNCSSTFRYRLECWLQQLGMRQWPKITHNLRASWIQDLESGGIRQSTISSWAGNSQAVRDKHYNSPHEGDFETFKQLMET